MTQCWNSFFCGNTHTITTSSGFSAPFATFPDAVSGETGEDASISGGMAVCWRSGVFGAASVLVVGLFGLVTRLEWTVCRVSRVLINATVS